MMRTVVNVDSHDDENCDDADHHSVVGQHG